MITTYDPNIHTAAVVTIPGFKDEADLLRHPMAIVMVTSANRVWLQASYHYEGVHPSIQEVRDGTPYNQSDSGDMLISVPAECCLFCTEREADDINELIAIDDRLMSYAR